MLTLKKLIRSCASLGIAYLAIASFAPVSRVFGQTATSRHLYTVYAVPPGATYTEGESFELEVSDPAPQTLTMNFGAPNNGIELYLDEGQRAAQ